MTEPAARATKGPRADSREVLELKALRDRQPDLAEAVDLHLELLGLQRRVQSRVPVPTMTITAALVAQHNQSGLPLLPFEDIPVEITDLRLMIRQTADVLHRHGVIDAEALAAVEAIGRDDTLMQTAAAWYARTARTDQQDPAPVDQVLALALKPFLARCVDVAQPHSELGAWTHPHCALCGGEPDMAVITPAAERHLLCGRCGLQWKFEPLTCPYCLNTDRTRITSFATTDGQYRVYACDVCQRYLKAFDGRRGLRPVMPTLDGVATLPLDAAAMQRGYT